MPNKSAIFFTLLLGFVSSPSLATSSAGLCAKRFLGEYYISSAFHAMGSRSAFKRAAKYAREMHKGEVRKFDGKPYFSHPIRVARIVRKKSFDTDLVIASLLHDTVEDTAATRQEIHFLFGARVAGLVEELTTDKFKVSVMGKTRYLTDKMMKMSLEALLIKLADRLDNTSDFAIAPRKFKEKYSAETRAILSKISSRKDLMTIHKLLIQEISMQISI